VTEKKHIGIFGGVFNPPHIGHLAVAECARDFLNLDIVYWVPSGNPPHKRISDQVSKEMRLKLVNAVVEGNSSFRIFADEMERGGITYSIETARKIKKLNPDSEIYFLLGTDAYISLPTWQSIDELMRLVHFVVYPRGRESAPNLKSSHAIFLDAHNVDLSSSDIRDKLSILCSVRYLVPEAVLQIIEDEALYTSELNSGMRKHIDAVERASVYLAELWGIPPWAARLAAKYHDAYKSFSAVECVKILERRGEIPDDFERKSAPLLHGKVAAERIEMIAQRRGYDDSIWSDIANAVRYHTTGREGMSELEKLLMVADRFGKDWNELSEIPVNPKVAIRFVLKRKMEILKQKGVVPLPAAISACREHEVEIQ